MASKKWCIGLTGLRESPNGRKILDIPPGAVIDITGMQEIRRMDGHDVLWSEITYRGHTAWANDRLLEDYEEKYPEEVLIPNPTAEPNDAAQYMLLDGRIKYNMCGELCAAFVGGDDIETFVAKWELVSPKFYKWALMGNNDNPTGIDALESMLRVYGYEFPMLRFQAGLTDPVIGFKVTPRRLQRMLKTHYLIINANIDGQTGKLRGQGVGHWVVVDSIQPYGINGGWVLLYNPFPNRRQEYSYDEFINSGGINRVGVWVPRPQAPEPLPTPGPVPAPPAEPAPPVDAQPSAA